MRRIRTLSFHAPEELSEGIGRVAAPLCFVTGEPAELTVTARRGSDNTVSLSRGEAEITYTDMHLFFRLLGLLLEHADEASFTLREERPFQTVGLMLDASRGAVPTVESACRMLAYLAVMGYNMAMLYTEDTVELEGRPYFGYMRGRYTAEELRAIDDCAFSLGIELIPCIECYGHMEKYLIWDEALPIKDTDRILLAREERTFAFLDELIGTVSSSVRSRRIHVGMDEAWDMGRGKFLTKHGYVPPFQIFNEYMERLISITRKHGLRPMMWSDMYFRVCTPNKTYYEEDTVVPPEVSEHIPEEMELVFWHYGEKPHCDRYMLKKHTALGRNTIFCGGLWSWSGHFPENHYTKETTDFSLAACREEGIREVMTSLWLNDNAECDIFSCLLGLSYFAERVYRPEADEAFLRSRFAATTGGDADAFMTMSDYHNSFGGEGDDYEGRNWWHRFSGKALFWQDILEGIHDHSLYKKPMSEHYRGSAAALRAHLTGGEWDGLYEHAALILELLAEKTYIAERLRPAYQAGDRETLATLADVHIPALARLAERVRVTHRALWFQNLKTFGWANMDIRYAGMAARCETAALLLSEYLDGERKEIEALEEDRLPKGSHGFMRYSSIATVNISI